jgi:aldose 1-epimerase
MSAANGTHPVVVSGDDIELSVLPELGARLDSLRVHGRELLRHPDAAIQHEREPFFWGGFVMAPWCNRLTPGPVEFRGRVVDLRPNFEDGSAIHGQVYVAPWLQIGDAVFAIEHEGDGWPWRYRVQADYSVDALRVAVTLRLRNLSDSPMPGGIGLHPWFPVPVDVRIASSLTYGNAKDSHVEPRPVEGDLDLRNRAPIAEGVDATWAQPADPAFELWWRTGLHGALHAPFQTLHVVAAYAPERGAIAIEPQTHAPQGLRRLLNAEPGAMALIEPGDEITLPITLEFDGGA